MKFAILGWRHDHAEHFIHEMQDLGHEFLGVCEDNNQAKIDKILEKYKVPQLTEEELFALKPDAVMTTAINNEKIDVIERCNERGVHIMVDKPIAINMEDYLRLEKVVKQEKIKVGLLLTERFDPAVYTLRKMIRDGKLGDLVSFTSFGPHKLVKKSRPAWHFEDNQCGGVAVDLLIHHVDLLRWFSDSEIAQSSGFINKIGNPDLPDFYENANVTAVTENKVIGALEADWLLPLAPENYGDVRVICLCTEGRAVIKTSDAGIGIEGWHLVVATDTEKVTRPEVEAPPHTLTGDFLRRIEGEKDVIVTADDILKSTLSTLKVSEQAIRIR